MLQRRPENAFPLTSFSHGWLTLKFSFAVPTTVDDAIRATLEIESYAKPMPVKVAQLAEEPGEEDEAVAMAAPHRAGELKLLLDKMSGWRPS